MALMTVMKVNQLKIINNLTLGNPTKEIPIFEVKKYKTLTKSYSPFKKY